MKKTIDKEKSSIYSLDTMVPKTLFLDMLMKETAMYSMVNYTQTD